MGFLSEGVAVITGAGSGMGRCLAQQLAGMGASLAISDVDEKGLAETVALMGSPKG
jgi:NAD(P)-dependent dehydrogenase (short-subunit alcohol dehydrogenase family)